MRESNKKFSKLKNVNNSAEFDVSDDVDNTFNEK